jgi:hypothetical protein
MSPNLAPLSAWMTRLVHRRPAAQPTSSILMSRVEVRPPEQWPSSLTWRGALLRWWQRQVSHLPEAARPINRLALVKDEFLAAVTDLQHGHAQLVAERIGQARSLRELWHLRSSIYNLVALALSQREAERRLAHLNRHFPMRTARLGADITDA